jgi:PleD family two-component response regulator
LLTPISQLTAAAARLGSGDLSARVQTQNLAPELKLLGETFNQMAGQLAEHKQQLQRTNEALSNLASTDNLTGIANRRAFDAHLEAEWLRARRRGEPLGKRWPDWGPMRI